MTAIAMLPSVKRASAEIRPDRSTVLSVRQGITLTPSKIRGGPCRYETSVCVSSSFAENVTGC